MGVESITSYRIVCDGCGEFHTDYWYGKTALYDAMQAARRRAMQKTLREAAREMVDIIEWELDLPRAVQEAGWALEDALTEERLYGIEGENQRLGARVAELEGALIAIVECSYPTYWGWFHSNDNPREIARAALGVE